MPPNVYTVQRTAAETALELARDAGDLAAMLAALATMTQLVRLQYTAAKLAARRPACLSERPGGLAHSS